MTPTERLAILRALEWCDPFSMHGECPTCGRSQAQGHEPGCGLSALIAEQEALEAREEAAAEAERDLYAEAEAEAAAIIQMEAEWEREAEADGE